MTKLYLFLGVLISAGVGLYAYQQTVFITTQTSEPIQNEMESSLNESTLIDNPAYVASDTVFVPTSTAESTNNAYEAPTQKPREQIQLKPVKAVELPKIAIPTIAVVLPEHSALSAQNDQPALIQSGTATSDMSGALTSNTNNVRQLQVDPNVLQSVEQQTGIPTYELEQAFLQESQ